MALPSELPQKPITRQVTDFIQGTLSLAGVDDEPTYTRNKIINTQEEMQSVLMAAPYVTREYLTRKLLTILGDADMAEEILKQLSAEDLNRFDGGGDDMPPEDGAEDVNGDAA